MDGRAGLEYEIRKRKPLQRGVHESMIQLCPWIVGTDEQHDIIHSTKYKVYSSSDDRVINSTRVSRVVNKILIHASAPVHILQCTSPSIQSSSTSLHACCVQGPRLHIINGIRGYSNQVSSSVGPSASSEGAESVGRTSTSVVAWCDSTVSRHPEVP